MRDQIKAALLTSLILFTASVQAAEDYNKEPKAQEQSYPKNQDQTAQNDQKQKEQIGEHVPVNSRPLSIEKRKLQLDQNVLEQEENETNQKSFFGDIDEHAKMSKNSRNNYPTGQSYATYYYPITSHWLNSFSLAGNTFEMEDGSHWLINPWDSYIVSSWRVGDPLEITPCTNWFSSYNYYVTNKNTNTYIQANLYLGPIIYGPYSHWIIGIDTVTAHAYLENGSVWCIHPSDQYLFKDWLINDTIIMGTHSSLLPCINCYDVILINVNMNHYVRAKLY